MTDTYKPSDARGMEAVLKFPLPECQSEFQMACQAADLKGALWDLDEWLRGGIKYGSLPEQDKTVLEIVRKQLYEILESHNIILHD